MWNILLQIFSFHRIFAPKCNACGDGITPVEGTSDTVRVVAMEKDFHVDCYVCEVRFVIFSVIFWRPKNIELNYRFRKIMIFKQKNRHFRGVECS